MSAPRFSRHPIRLFLAPAAGCLALVGAVTGIALALTWLVTQPQPRADLVLKWGGAAFLAAGIAVTLVLTHPWDRSDPGDPDTHAEGWRHGGTAAARKLATHFRARGWLSRPTRRATPQRRRLAALAGIAPAGKGGRHRRPRRRGMVHHDHGRAVHAARSHGNPPQSLALRGKP